MNAVALDSADEARLLARVDEALVRALDAPALDVGRMLTELAIVLVPDLAAACSFDDGELGADSVTVPLVARGRRVGALTLGAPRSSPELVARIASRIAVALAHGHARAGEETALALLDSVLHELRNPLTAIVGNAYVPSAALRDPVYAPLRAIGRAAARMQRTLDDCADHPSQGELVLDRARCRLSELMREVSEASIGQAAARDITLDLRTGDDPSLSFDRERMLRVLFHLLEGCVRATPAGGTIAISVEAGSVRMACSRGEPRTSVSFGSEVARRIVEAHGGSIGSSRVGDDLVVLVSLPNGE